MASRAANKLAKSLKPRRVSVARHAGMPVTTTRFFLVDALRGVAVALMFAYHFAFDLNYFGLIRVDFYRDPFWLDLRALIVSLFLLLAGVSLVLANRRGVDLRAALPRLSRLFGAAVLVSSGSYVLFPASMIFFGVLHFIFVASLLGLLFLRLRWTNLALGLLLVMVGLSVRHPWFDQAWLQWFGLMTHKPITEDYVPLLPWFGVVLVGIFLGRYSFCGTALPPFARWQPAGSMARVLAFAGRHSLLLYLLHQPVLLGLLYMVARLKA